jgi:K+-dependent Na+/Ca+ exchanger-like protein
MAVTCWRTFSLLLMAAAVLVYIYSTRITDTIFTLYETAPKVMDAQHIVSGQSQETALVPQKVQAQTFLTEEPNNYIVIDRAYLKWLWWPLLAYLFWGMAYICDDYFVRTIEVISERFHIPDDVAGATLMALGCNGPEMALNTISIFNPSDIGVGAVIGGEVFNVLVIIGTAMLATPDMYLPLRISKFSFFRDIMFYIFSVMLLYSILKDGEISRVESLSLIAGAVVYSTTVASSAMIRRGCYNMQRKFVAMFRSPDTRVSNVSLQSVDSSHFELAQNRETCRSSVRKSMNIAEVLNGPRSTRGASDYDAHAEDVSELSDFENEAEDELIEAWSGAMRCDDPFVGSVVGIRVEVRSRMMDRVNRVEQRYMWLTDNALMVSTAVDPQFALKQKGRAYDLVYDTRHQMWHHGGIINVPNVFDDTTKPEEARSPQNTLSDALIRASVSGIPDQAFEIPGLHEVPCEAIPLKNVLYCDPVPGAPKMFTLHIHQEGDLGLGRLITVEFLCNDSSVHDAWVEALRNTLCDRSLRQGPSADHPPLPESFCEHVWKWVAWFQFPVKMMAKATIPDMDRPELQKWYPLAFIMSMAWLAVFAYLVVSACDGIHDDFGIPTGLLGFTIAAAGTSFPNVFSGMVVSRQGKTTMALANALGANVQNVFLALAVPWTIKSCLINHGPFAMPVQGLAAQIAAIYITLIPVVFIYLCNACTMPRWSGYVFLVTYCAYLIIALGEQSTGCMRWPLHC